MKWDNSDAIDQLTAELLQLACGYRVTAVEMNDRQRYELLRASAELAGEMAQELPDWKYAAAIVAKEDPTTDCENCSCRCRDGSVTGKQLLAALVKWYGSGSPGRIRGGTAGHMLTYAAEHALNLTTGQAEEYLAELLTEMLADQG